MNENQQNDAIEQTIGKNEDVEFSCELADEDDREALARAEAADERQENS